MANRCSSGPLVVFAVAVLAVSCGRPKTDDEEAKPAEVPTITAEVAKVARQTLTDDLSVRGAIVAIPNEDVRVSAQVAGRVNKVTVAEGDAVASGQILAEIDRRPGEEQQRQARAALDQANAQVENARLNLQRNQQLFERGIAAGKEVEDARTQMATAQAAVEQATSAINTAKLQLDRTEVRSPIAGQVVKRMVSVGEQVDGTAAQPIAEIANLDRVELAASVPADQLSRIKISQPATVSTEAYSGRTFLGTVIAIAPAVDAASNTALVRIRLPNPGRLLKVGMFAEARLQLDQHPNALVVPPSAIVRTAQGAAVYVVSNGTAQRTAVTTGLERDAVVEILTGLSEGQTVLTSSVYGLGEKAKLAPAGHAS